MGQMGWMLPQLPCESLLVSSSHEIVLSQKLTQYFLVFKPSMSISCVGSLFGSDAKSLISRLASMMAVDCSISFELEVPSRIKLVVHLVQHCGSYNSYSLSPEGQQTSYRD